MSNVIGFKAYKNTLKRDSGYAPVSGENGYSVIRCVFPVGGDWDNISAVSAGFFVHPKNIAGVTAAITDDGEERAALFTIPGALLKQGERLHFGLFATVGGVTIATNTVALDVERGIVSDDIDYDPEEAAGMFEQFSNALNTALLGKANKAAAGSAGELAALDGNGSPIRSGVSVIQSIGEGSNSRVPTTAAVKNALDGKADKAADGTDGELAALDDNGSPIRSGVTVAQSVGEGSADKVPTTEAVKTALDGKADKLVNGDVAFTDRILIASNNGGIKNSGYTINNARLSGDVNLTVPSSNVVAIALEGKADKAADGTDGELAALDGNGALKRSGVTVAQSVGEGSADKVPTTEAVKTALDGKADKLVNGDVAFTDRILIASNNGGIKNSGYTINNARLSGDVNLTVPSSNVVAIALEGKADKAAAGTDGELAALDDNGALKRSGVTVAQSVGEGSADKVPTTEAVRNALNDTIENLGAIPYSVKLAMDTLFSKAAYADDDAASSYATFHAWAFSNLVTFITAVFTQGSATIHDTDSLDTLKQYLTVTATHPESTTSTVTDYTLSGTLTEGTSTITVSYGGKTTTFTVTVTADPTGIHDEYQKVEWIEANHAPVIDTLFVPSVNTEIHAGIQFIDSTAGAGTNNCVFGSTTPSVLVLGGQSTMYMNFARQSSAVASNTLKNSLHDVVLNKDTCTVDGVTAVTFSGSPLSFTTPRHMMIFAFPKDDNQTPDHKSHSRCSYFQAYDNGVLAADLVPCYRKADGVIGMYDRVAQAFRTNVGTGTFTKGGDVT